MLSIADTMNHSDYLELRKDSAKNGRMDGAGCRVPANPIAENHYVLLDRCLDLIPDRTMAMMDEFLLEATLKAFGRCIVATVPPSSTWTLTTRKL